MYTVKIECKFRLAFWQGRETLLQIIERFEKSKARNQNRFWPRTIFDTFQAMYVEYCILSSEYIWKYMAGGCRKSSTPSSTKAHELKQPRKFKVKIISSVSEIIYPDCHDKVFVRDMSLLNIPKW